MTINSGIACTRCGYPDGTAEHACNPSGVAGATELYRKTSAEGQGAYLLKAAYAQAIADEAQAQHALFAAEDSLIPMERRLETLKAGAILATQDGRNEDVRKALTLGVLDQDEAYQAALKDADQQRAAVRYLRLEVTVAQHMREMAYEALRLERARLISMGVS